MSKTLLLALVLLVASPILALAQQGTRPNIIPRQPRGFFDRSMPPNYPLFPPGVYRGPQYWYLFEPTVVVPYGPFQILQPASNFWYVNPNWYVNPHPFQPQPMVPERPPAAPREAPPAGPKPPPAQEPPIPMDDVDQRGEMYRFLRAGNRAFANGKYDEAMKAYVRAQVAAPMEAHPAFHAGQAHLALGNYHKAFSEIQRGLRWQPHWPDAEFKPRAFYGTKATTYAKHLARLAEAVERNPNDDSLLFLLGYQLWFDGKREDAEVLFRRAATLTLDRTHVDRFLQGDKDK